MNYSSGWSSYLVSPDYYNACSSSGLSIPLNSIGYQAAADGNAYGGIIAYDVGGQAREILGRPLSQSLIIGAEYFVSMKVSLAEFFGSTPQYVPCNKIGFKFSTIPFTVTTPPPINNLAHIYTNTIINDTMNWITIKGSIIADSSYQYIMIGNFFDDTQTDTTYRVNGIRSYFFVDDICVSTNSLSCSGFTNLYDLKNTVSFNIYPNPATYIVSIEFEPNSEYWITMFNNFGKEIYKEKTGDNAKINVSSFSNGLYFLKAQSSKGTLTKKIIINH